MEGFPEVSPAKHYLEYYVSPFFDKLVSRSRLLEMMLVSVVLMLTWWMWYYSVESPVLLHLYYLPVVMTGFFLGRYRARLMALLCILNSTIIFLPYLTGTYLQLIPLSTLLAYCIWAGMLLLIAGLNGTMSDRWRDAMEALRDAHKKDVLTDALTGVANRRAYEFELSRRFAEWNRDQSPLSLVMIDIDFFKEFNDRYGHQAGDKVLCDVAQSLQQSTRESDLVARYGGEEFGIIIPGIQVEEARDLAERIRSIIESSRYDYNELKLGVTVSVGFAYVIPEDDACSLVQRADAALYASKEAGRNCVHMHTGTTCEPFGLGITSTQSTALASNNSNSPAYIDDITGIPTRKVFLDELRRRSAERNRYGSLLSIAMVEIAGLKHLGLQQHHQRKSLLATVAKLTGSVLRETDLIARFNEVSLCAMLPSTAGSNAVHPMMRLIEKTANHVDPKYPQLKYNTTIGVVEIIPDEKPGSLLQRLTDAMLFAEQSGGDVVCYHDGTKNILMGSSAPGATVI